MNEILKLKKKKKELGNSLVVQWLGLHASTAGGIGSIPGWETNNLHATRHGKKRKKGNFCL